MKNYNLITIFPEFIFSFLRHGFIKRAIDSELLTTNIINLRDFSNNKHKKVDDKAYGGGPGMVLSYDALKGSIKSIQHTSHIVYPSPQGKPLVQSDLKRLSSMNDITFICGRYEGIDERIITEHVDEEISLGDYVISSGESASLVLLEGITRLIPGAIDDYESVLNDSFQDGILDHPQYTRPDSIDGLMVPDVLRNGNHSEIQKWRRKHALGATWRKRPDLLKNVKLSEEDDRLLEEYKIEFKSHGNK